MSYGRKHGTRVAGSTQQALRQTGRFDWHPDACACRKCRRMRAAATRRSTAPRDAVGREMGAGPGARA